MALVLETENSMEYRFYPVHSKAIKFNVKAAHDAHIALVPVPVEANPMYEIFIGGWDNTKCAIRKNREKPDVAEHPFPNTLDANEYKSFWLTFYDSVIALGVNDDCTPLLVWNDPSLFEVSHFGIRTGWGATGSWRIDDSWNGWRGGQSNTATIGWNVSGTGGDGTWVPTSSGSIPPNPIEGGFDNEQIFIGRAYHEGSLTPGKVVPSHGVCYIAWGGAEHALTEYEVLCDCRGTWIRTTGDNIPPTAVKGGVSETGEPLYIGRAEVNSTLTVGKVHKSHGACYIPYGGEEIKVEEFEVLAIV